MLDKTKLPALSVTIVEDYFQKIDNVSFDSVFLLVQFYISRLLCSNRVKIVNKTSKIDTFPNLYCLTIGRSGSKKDKHKKIMDDLISFYYDDMMAKERVFRRDQEYQLKAEAEKEGLKGPKINSFVYEGMPRAIPKQIGRDTTPEGLADVHEVLSRTRFGNVVWADSEISDTMLNYRRGGTLDQILVMIKEAYDNGQIIQKIIKSDKNPKNFKKVPYLAWLHGTLDGDKRQKMFDNFFSGGYGRRLLICNNRNEELENRSLHKIKDDLIKATEQEEFIIKTLKDIYKRTESKVNSDHDESNHFKLSEEAEITYLEYKLRVENMAKTIPKYTNDSLIDELANRNWKALKLSCVFAVQDSFDFVIEKKHIEQAIYVVDHYAKYFKELLELDNGDSIAEMMINSLNSGRMKKTDFYKKNYFPKFASGQPKIFDEQIKIAKEIAEASGRLIVETKEGTTSWFELIDLPTRDRELDILTYIQENGVLSCLTMDVLVNKFGVVLKYIIDKYKIKKREDGGYYI